MVTFVINVPSFINYDFDNYSKMSYSRVITTHT